MRVVTYNVHKCRGLDGRIRARRIAEVLEEISPDIIALQEVIDYQAEMLSDALDMPYALGETRRRLGHAYGTVVLSKFPIRTSKSFDLSVRGRERRGCLRTDLALEGRLLHVFNVHLGTALIERRVQGRKLMTPEMLNAHEIASPRIVLGDFNEWTRGLATRLLRSHLESAGVRSRRRRSGTFPGILPLFPLDHIYYDPALHLEQLTLHRSRRALMASDHLPLIGDFRWSKKENGSK